MALPVRSYVWPRIKRVAWLFVSRVTGLDGAKVQWDDQNQPSPGLPYIALRRRSFPAKDGFGSEVIAELPVSATLDVTASTAGETVAVLLFGTRYAYTLAGGDDATAARDALLELIEPDLARTVTNVAGDRSFGVGFQPCTAASSGAAAIDFAGLSSGAMRLHVIEGADYSETRAYRYVSEGLYRALVRVELFWPQDFAPFESADDYAEAIRAALADDASEAEWLQQRGVGVDQAALISIQDASAIAGGLRERRLFLDVIFNASAKRYKADPVGIDGANFVVEVAV